MSQDSSSPPVAGLVTLPSTRNAAATLDRLESLLHQKGIRVFARIDHAGGASDAGLTLRPTAVLIFGNPPAGTPLMQGGQTIGIDLPLKALEGRKRQDVAQLQHPAVPR